jgi:hypothetical protein
LIVRWLLLAAPVVAFSISLSAGAAALAAGSGRAVRPQCPQHVTFRPKHNKWKEANEKLAPANPSRVLLCRYTTRLVRHVVVGSHDVRPLVLDYDAFGTSPPKRPGFSSCFLRPDPVVAYLTYRNDRQVTIYSATSSCVYPTNGDLTGFRTNRDRTRLLREFRKLVGS